ncbi:MAG: hypothetical protein Fues2KO_46860 [Fuerstiella sp.]
MTEAQDSTRKIWVFGNADKSEHGFQEDEDQTRYLAGELFTKENGRYRQTLIRDADIGFA